MPSLIKETERLQSNESKICVTLSLPTHRTFPENKQDLIQLGNMTREAEKQLIERFGKRESQEVMKKLNQLQGKIDTNHLLDSLHIYLSEDVLEIINLPYNLDTCEVIVGEQFDLTYLKDAADQSRDYLILVLSQGGVHLYHAFNDGITGEYTDHGFPFKQNPHYITHSDKASDPKKVDHQVREYFNTVDKSVVKASLDTGLNCVVVATERNFQHLMAVADKKAIYMAHSNINYNQTATHEIAKQAWEALDTHV